MTVPISIDDLPDSAALVIAEKMRQNILTATVELSISPDVHGSTASALAGRIVRTAQDKDDPGSSHRGQ